MSYLVLARKWRPRNFGEMVGQEHVLRALVNALDENRLHHAFLFAGTRGVGKTTLGRILAKCLNCERGVSSNPCGECSACKEIDEGRFVDLIEVDAASRTKVDDTRELLDNVQYAPTRGRYKVYLIDEVHMLSAHSFNALLKTLEEPPPHVKFLLATTNPQKLPVTVLSRCLKFNLKRLSVSQIHGRLAEILLAEGVESENEALVLLSRAADGSMRDALSLLDQAISFGGGAVRAADVREMLGSLDMGAVIELIEALARGDAGELLELVESLDEYAPDYQAVLGELVALLQRIALQQAVPDADSDEDDPKELAELAQQLTPEDAQLFYQIALIGRRDLPLAPDPRGGFEMVLLRMLTFRPAESVSGSDVQPKAVSKRRPKLEPAETNKREAAVAASGTGPGVPESSDWAGIIAAAGIGGATRQLAANCELVGRDENTVHLRLDTNHEHLRTKRQEAQLESALRDYFGSHLKLRLDVGEPQGETPAELERRVSSKKMQEARDSLDKDPNVRALKETFGATVQPETVRPLD